MLTLRGSDTYIGNTNFNGGLIDAASFDNLGGNAGTSLLFNGGGLQWATGASSFDPSARTMTFNAGGATLDTNGNNVTLANAINAAGGTGALTKAGAGSDDAHGGKLRHGRRDDHGRLDRVAGAKRLAQYRRDQSADRRERRRLGTRRLDASDGRLPAQVSGTAGVGLYSGEIKLLGPNTLSTADAQTVAAVNVNGAKHVHRGHTRQRPDDAHHFKHEPNDDGWSFALGPRLNLGASGNAKVMITAGATPLGRGTGNAIGILPYALGDTSATGTGMGLVTYDATNGVRLLNTATEYNSSLTGGNNNVRLTSSSATLSPIRQFARSRSTAGQRRWRSTSTPASR